MSALVVANRSSCHQPTARLQVTRSGDLELVTDIAVQLIPLCARHYPGTHYPSTLSCVAVGNRVACIELPEVWENSVWTSSCVLV